ncbi:hypothetical protein [Acidisphaera sp. L21]|uniref:hypothetical protein n=1 Tax=Acidisphaera sp. L21 TaxID=1641851 RepID=UPI00131E40B6|nr:hypothetical protein [Acidisphaera sp. L21]
MADVIVTASAGPGTGTELTTQIMKGETMLYSLLDDSPKQSTRVAYIQFANDPYGGNKTHRADRLETMLRPKVESLLLIDQPGGYTGHGAAYTAKFAYQFGECIKRFVESAAPLSGC